MIPDLLPRNRLFDSEKLAAIRQRLQAFVDTGELAGIVTLASHRGEIVQAEAIGWRDIEAHSPMQHDALFRIASMTKPITSVAALMLLEEGKIVLDDPIERWVPELAGRRVLRTVDGPLDDIVPAVRPITIEDLLTHRSGIAYAFFSEGPLQAAYERSLGDPALNPMTAEAWLAALGSLPLAYQPGTRFHYGHSSDVLGFLIGRVEGKSFRDVLLERVIGPLGMTDTDFWVPPDKRGRIASLYAYDDRAGQLAKVDWHKFDAPPSYTPGGGGLISTAPDYHRFVRMLLQNGQFGGTRFLRPETVKLMRTNRLTPDQRTIPFAGMPLWRTNGFGLGVSLAENGTDNPYACGAPGSMTWPGIFGTWWQADPINDLAMIYLIQHQVPVSAGLGATVATGRGAAGRRALPIFQHGIYGSLKANGK